MKTYLIEAWADGRPVQFRGKDTVEATSVGTALARGYRLAKPFMRGRARTVTVRATRLTSA